MLAIKDRKLKVSVEENEHLLINYGDLVFYRGKLEDSYKNNDMLKNRINIDKIDFIINSIPTLCKSRGFLPEEYEVEITCDDTIIYYISERVSTCNETIEVSLGISIDEINEIELKFLQELSKLNNDINLNGMNIYVQYKAEIIVSTKDELWSFDANEYTVQEAEENIRQKTNETDKYIVKKSFLGYSQDLVYREKEQSL